MILLVWHLMRSGNKRPYLFLYVETFVTDKIEMKRPTERYQEFNLINLLKRFAAISISQWFSSAFDSVETKRHFSHCWIQILESQKRAFAHVFNGKVIQFTRTKSAKDRKPWRSRKSMPKYLLCVCVDTIYFFARKTDWIDWDDFAARTTQLWSFYALLSPNGGHKFDFAFIPVGE